ncbi:hypothetical protein V2J09_016162 [Rumex salicifolius]
MVSRRWDASDYEHGPEDPSENTPAVLANDAVLRLPTVSTISGGADLDAAGSDGENCKDKFAAQIDDSLHKKRPAKLDDEETSADVPLHCELDIQIQLSSK